MTEAATPTRSKSTASGSAPPAPAETSLIDRARDRANEALDATKASARDVAARASDGVVAAPLAVVAGGLALGAVAGALIPRSAKEAELLGPLGQKLNEGAVTAARAAREAGKAELTAAGLSRVGANEQVGKLLEGVVKAVTSAGTAARDSRKAKG